MADTAFRRVSFVFGVLIVALVALMVYEMAQQSSLSMRTFGPAFLTSTTWDPQHRAFGALPFIYGTVVSSVLALVIATPISLGVAIFLVEMSPNWLGNVISAVVELLAAIPSVLLGLWGIFVMVPFLQRYVEPALQTAFPGVPLFDGAPYGVGLLAAGLILAIMIVPTIVAISRDVMASVPIAQREGMLALGATKWETTRRAVLPYARSGIVGAMVLGLGRALGETMAVTMVIGNRPVISPSLLDPSYTMASVIANEFTEATYELYVSALIEIGLVLFAVTILMNAAARLLVARTARGMPVAP
ncbi:MAG: phosphate ABC transporter permease subunit PstC [Chloroflexota bacterium]|nr:phosphate ABC transporter permease subunit PstC [Chloroflexota bacterium]MDE3193549.1 phosphate ABC transporter permease subunit PstC [Chloroflexota bacterium]